MNITFLIGNGFDVGLGLHSKFKDFFPIYCENSKNKPENIKQLSKEINGNYETWADFEIELGKYTLKFDKTTKNNFIAQIKDFETEFIKYLEMQENNLSFQNTESISKIFIDGLLHYYTSNNLESLSVSAINETYSQLASELRSYNFINFNYTDALENCLNTISQGIIQKRKYGSKELVDKIQKIVHIHGSKTAYPIIGLNDESQILNEELAKDTKFVRNIVKPKLCQLLRQGNDNIAIDLISKSTIICIYGMSLGPTDKKWWDLLVTWLSANSRRQLIIFDYDNNFSPSTPFGKIEKDDYYIEKLNEYNSKKSLDVESLRNRIHIAIHKNIFEMNLTKNQEMLTDLDNKVLVNA